MKIINFGQVIDVETRNISHQIVVEMLDGQQAMIKTDEGTVQQLIEAMSTPALAPTPQPVYMEEAPEAAEYFGGDMPEDPGETYEPIMGSISEEPSPPRETERGGLGQAKPPRRVVTDSDGFALPVRSRTVPKDEMGYPIINNAPRRTGPWDEDESGDGAQI